MVFLPSCRQSAPITNVPAKHGIIHTIPLGITEKGILEIHKTDKFKSPENKPEILRSISESMGPGRQPSNPNPSTRGSKSEAARLETGETSEIVYPAAQEIGITAAKAERLAKTGLKMEFRHLWAEP